MIELAGLPVPVCFVAGHAQLGGAELYLDSLLASLGPEWIGEVLVLEEGPLVSRLQAKGSAARVVPCGRRLGLLAGAGRMRRILLKRSPRLIHANGVKAALVSTIAVAGTGIPVAWHKHDSARDGWLAHLIGRRCDVVVGVSSAAVATLVGVRGVRTTVVQNGIPRYETDRPAARRALLRALDATPDSHLIGQVGRLHPGKGQLELLEIAPELRTRLPELRLIFVGAGDPHEPDYAERLKVRTHQLGLDDCVTFLGYREDAVEILAGCDVLAMPSLPDLASGWREGFPLTPLEAMAVGTPVAGYAEPGIVEAVGSCGELVPTGDRERLREAIAGLVEDPERRARLRDCGWQRVRGYELPEAAERMKEAYLAVAGKRRDPAPGAMG